MLENIPLDQLSRILAALALVFLAAIISRWQKLDLEKDIVVASVRAFIQLIAIGYALTLIFAVNSPLAILALLAWGDPMLMDYCRQRDPALLRTARQVVPESPTRTCTALTPARSCVSRTFTVNRLGCVSGAAGGVMA